MLAGYYVLNISPQTSHSLTVLMQTFCWSEVNQVDIDSVVKEADQPHDAPDAPAESPATVLRLPLIFSARPSLPATSSQLPLFVSCSARSNLVTFVFLVIVSFSSRPLFLCLLLLLQLCFYFLQLKSLSVSSAAWPSE